MAAWITVLAVPGVARSAPASTCERAAEGPTVATQSAAWRAAVDALREATGDPSQPWGCSGGSVDLVEHDGRATLLVRTATGATVSREVDSPDDVVPLGEALFARPAPIVEVPPPEQGALPAPAPTQVSPSRGPAEAAKAPIAGARLDPRVIVSAVAAPRYAGRTNLILGGATAAVGLPLASWVPALWVRFDGPLAKLEEHGNSMMELCAGAAFGRSFPVKALEIRASLNASLAVVLKPEHAKPPGETQLDGRIGAEARFAFPRTSLLRAVVTTDTEIAPGNFDESATPDPLHPPPFELPSYTIGLGVGVEIAPR